MVNKDFLMGFGAGKAAGSGPFIEVEPLSVSANSIYSAPSGKAYSPVTVDVPNTYEASDEGKVVNNGALVAQTSKNVNANGTVDTTLNNQVVVDVPNTYVAGDEGKVVSNGSLVAQTAHEKVTQNGIIDTTLNNSVEIDVSSSGGAPEWNDVNFIDYDGTLLYSYTAQEALALSEMPSNPTHTGLTAQGWNYTLAEMKAQVTAQGDCTIGQMYVTSDGKTRLYCHFENGRVSPYLGLCVNGTVSIDWGDGSSIDSLTGTSLSTLLNVQHIYPSSGDYVITLTPSPGTEFKFKGDTGSGSQIIYKNAVGTNSNAVYAASLVRVELGENVSLGVAAFYYCLRLKTISIPRGISFANSLFRNCKELTCIVVPPGVTDISNYMCNACVALAAISLPESVTSISTYGFNACTSLARLSLPRRLSSLGNNWLENVSTLRFLKIPSTVSGTGGNGFQGCSSLQKVILPDSLTAIANSAFYNCMALEEVNLPSSITYLGSSAFYNCQNLKRAIIRIAATSISASAFVQCIALAFVVIGDKIQAINGGAFSSCYGLGEIRFEASIPPTVANSAVFSYVPDDCVIEVPFSVLAAYLAASNYPNKADYLYIGYSTYANGSTLPSQDETQTYNITWYASKADAIAQNNQISQGNGDEIYCRYVAA